MPVFSVGIIFQIKIFVKIAKKTSNWLKNNKLHNILTERLIHNL